MCIYILVSLYTHCCHWYLFLQGLACWAHWRPERGPQEFQVWNRRPAARHRTWGKTDLKPRELARGKISKLRYKCMYDNDINTYIYVLWRFISGWRHGDANAAACRGKGAQGRGTQWKGPGQTSIPTYIYIYTHIYMYIL